MNALHEALGSGVAWKLGWAIIHSLWQGVAVALLHAGAMRLLRDRSPAARYAAALGALVLLLASCVVTFDVVTAPPQAIAVPVAPAMGTSIPASAVAAPSRTVPTVWPPVVAQASEAPVRGWSSVDPSIRLRPAVPWAGCAWLVGVLALGLWHAGGWVAAQRLRVLGAEPVDRATAELAQRIARRLHVALPVRVLRSLRVDTPLVVGWLRPVILLPVSVLAGLSPVQLEAVLAHELAHVRRHDYLVNLLQVAAETLMFYHPVVWWLSRRIRLEREHCCDDVAVNLSGDRCGYATALATLEEVRVAGRLQLAARGSGPRQLMARVRRILGLPGDASGQSRSRGAIAAALIAVVATIAACSHVRPTTGRPTGVIDARALVERLAQSETAIHNLTIKEFELTEEFKPEGSSDWHPTPISIAGDAWYGDPADSRFRLNVSQEVLPWEPFKADAGKPLAPGEVPFCEETFDIAFDGREGREVFAKTGWLGKSIAQAYAHVYPGERPMMDNPLNHDATGAAFSMSYRKEPTSRPSTTTTLSAVLRSALDHGHVFALTTATLDGREVVALSSGQASGRARLTLWFDPQHGYALVGRDFVLDGKVHESERVTRFIEAAPGVWYPAAGYRDEPPIDPKHPPGTIRHRFSVRKAVANDPAFDACVFTIATVSPMPVTVIRPPVVDVSALPQSTESDRALRKKSAATLSNLGGLLGIYANDFKGVYPPTVAVAAKEEEMSMSDLKSPFGDAKEGRDYAYLHFPGMARPLPDDLAIAYDAPDAASGEGASVLFADGSVRFLDDAALTAALKRARAVGAATRPAIGGRKAP